VSALALALGGFAIARRWGASWPVSAGFAWPLASGVAALYLLLQPGPGALAGTRVLASGVALLAGGTLAVLLARAAGETGRPAAGPTAAPLPLLVLALGVVAVQAGVLLRDIGRVPWLTDWDAWAIWGLKAQAFARDGSVDPYLADWSWYDFSWPARPCLISLAQAVLARGGAGLDEGAVRLMHLAWWGSLLLLGHEALRPTVGPRWALAYTVALATAPGLTYHASAGLSNLVLGCHLTALLVTIHAWEAGGRRGTLLLAALFAGFAALCRDEGTLLVAWLLAGFLLHAPGRQRALAAGAALSGAVATSQAWGAGIRLYEVWDLRSVWFQEGTPATLVRHFADLPQVLVMVLRELADPAEQAASSPLERWAGLSFLWPLALAAGLLGVRRLRHRSLPFAAGVGTAGGLATYILGLWAFPYQDLADLQSNWAFTLDRHLIALVPLAVIAAAGALHGGGPEGQRAP
jgi:hypothetical protein